MIRAEHLQSATSVCTNPLSSYVMLYWSRQSLLLWNTNVITVSTAFGTFCWANSNN
jgi:hypothetical protein